MCIERTHGFPVGLGEVVVVGVGVLGLCSLPGRGRTWPRNVPRILETNDNTYTHV